MFILFILNSRPKTFTVFSLAREIVESGNKVFFLLAGEDWKCEGDQLFKMLMFAENIYFLEVDSNILLHDLPEGVKSIYYNGWVELVEMCDKILSWN